MPQAQVVALLQSTGVRHIVLVTHGWHMPRALRAFEEAAAHAGPDWHITPAPMGLASSTSRPALRWMPSNEGFMLVRIALRERLGRAMGA